MAQAMLSIRQKAFKDAEEDILACHRLARFAGQGPTLADSYVHLTALLKDKNTSIARLRKLLFGMQTEKTKTVIGGGKDSESPRSASSSVSTVAETEKAAKIEPAFAELIRQAAQGEVLFNDDTTVKILELMGERAKEETFAEEAGETAAEGVAKKPRTERKGMFTSGIVSTRPASGCPDRKIALFFSGRKHAGELPAARRGGGVVRRGGGGRPRGIHPRPGT